MECVMSTRLTCSGVQLSCPDQEEKKKTLIFNWRQLLCSTLKMGSRLATCKIFRRGKCIVLLLISLSVVAWITTFSGENVKLFHVFYPVTLTLLKQDSTENTVNVRTTAPDDRHTRPPKAECPQDSPLLSKCTRADKERCAWLGFKSFTANFLASRSVCWRSSGLFLSSLSFLLYTDYRTV